MLEYVQLIQYPDPSVRFLALTELAGVSPSSDQARALRSQVPADSAVRAMLEAQYPAGYWMRPDLGIAPHYRATVWQVLFLAQLGLDSPPAVARALDMVLLHNFDGQAFRIQCHQRSFALTCALLWAWKRLGADVDPRLHTTWEWLASEVDQRYSRLAPYALAWLLRAAVAWQREDLLHLVSPRLLSLLAQAETFPLPPALSFPLTERGDMLMLLEALVEAQQTIPAWALDWLSSKQLQEGGWPLEHVPGRLWWDPGSVGEPNPWITVRALKIFSRALPGYDFNPEAVQDTLDGRENCGLVGASKQ